MKTNAIHAAQNCEHERARFVVIHPLDDAPEEKISTVGVKPLQLTTSVKLSLMALRVYLLLMTILLLYHVFGDWFRHWNW